MKRVYLNGATSEAGGAGKSNASDVWAAIKNSKDSKILEAFAERFAETCFADLATPKAQKLSTVAPKTTATASLVSMTTPKWQCAKGIQRVSRSETELALNGNTVISQSNKKWQRYFAANGTYVGKSAAGVPTSGNWRIGQNGIVYIDEEKHGSQKPTVYCPSLSSTKLQHRSFCEAGSDPAQATPKFRSYGESTSHLRNRQSALNIDDAFTAVSLPAFTNFYEVVPLMKLQRSWIGRFQIDLSHHDRTFASVMISGFLIKQ